MTHIDEMIHRWRTANGYRMPDTLYLGHTEFQYLMHEAQKFCVVPTGKPTVHPKYMGMDVMPVDVKSHVGFGTNIPSPAG